MISPRKKTLGLRDRAPTAFIAEDDDDADDADDNADADDDNDDCYRHRGP